MPPVPSHPEKGKLPVYGGAAIAMWFSIFTLALALLLDYFLWRALKQDPLVAWLTGINLMTLLTYFLDDQYRRAGYPLMPVSVFLVQAIAGGAFGIWSGMVIFNHTASREVFKRYLIWIIMGQLILVAIYLTFF